MFSIFQKKLSMAWHVHHCILLEPLTGPIRDRRQYIRKYKPTGERELRLRLLRPVRGELPKKYLEAWRNWAVAEGAYGEVEGTYEDKNRAYIEAQQAYKDYAKEIEALHREECPNCPWDGETIFPGRWA